MKQKFIDNVWHNLIQQRAKCYMYNEDGVSTPLWIPKRVCNDRVKLQRWLAKHVGFTGDVLGIDFL